MDKALAVIVTAAASCLLLASSLALAGEILVIDENLDTLPSGYHLQTTSTANATADFRIGNLGASNGLIFDGTWDVPANGKEQSAGILAPILIAPVEFQVDPADVGGISSVHWTLDAEVISSTMVPPDQGVYAILIVYQEQTNGSVLIFTDGGYSVMSGQSVSLDITATESDFGSAGNRPDFSATGRPLSFGLMIGAAYPRTAQPSAFYVDGRMTGDNWTVAVVTKGGIFNDRFEAKPVPSVLAARTSDKDCLCPAPPLIR